MVVFTNGCFDRIHIGHIRLLKFCCNIGSSVIVGLNSDKSVRRLKGINRPVYRQEYRKEVLESICYVDNVIIFEEDTPIELIKRIRPNIIVKGGDYKLKDVVGNKLAEVIIFPLIEINKVKVDGKEHFFGENIREAKKILKEIFLK